jgi:hypothetical protein
MIPTHRWTCWLCLLLSLLSSCRRADPEAPVRRLLDDCVQAARERDAAAIGQLLSPDFSDAEGRGPVEMEALLSGYFRQYPQAGVKVLGRRITLGATKDAARIECDLALKAEVGGFSLPIPGMGQSWIRVQLAATLAGGRWRISEADWREVGVGELLAETIPLLPKNAPAGGEGSP